MEEEEEEEEMLIAEEMADQIMRWDWRDCFREANKIAISEMIKAYGEQIKNNGK